LSENEYVATAAAQKRLREVLTGYLPSIDSKIIETFADALLSTSTVEYKSRAKQVVISLDLPDKAAISQSAATADLDQAVTETAPLGEGSPAAVYETAPAAPIPHLAPFAPVLDPEAEYEDVHFD
jgi:hypothetical protein